MSDQTKEVDPCPTVEPRETWIDLTIRPGVDPEVDVNPATGEFEYTYQLLEGNVTGRITILVPKSAADEVSSRVRELLALLPALAFLPPGLIS